MTNESMLSEQIKDSLEQSLKPPEEEVTYLNVMQALVEDKVDKYLTTTGTCNCPRCRIDVIALTLSKLPSKYIVVEKADAVPMLTVYENRFSTTIISQLMASCEQVKAHPRHTIHGEKPRGIAFVR